MYQQKHLRTATPFKVETPTGSLTHIIDAKADGFNEGD